MAARAQPMRIHFVGLLRWIVPVGLAIGLAGVYPTWRLGGPAALTAKLWAGGIVLVAVMLSGLLVVFSGMAGPQQVVVAFMGSGLIRMLLSVGLGLLLVWKAALPPVPLFVWLAIFYLAFFAAEGAWVARALRRHTAEPSLGEILAAGPMTQMDIE